MHKSRGFSLLIILILSLPLISTNGSMSVTTSDASQTLNSSYLLSDTFNEDFTTTTYRDAVETTASGWGDGSVAIQRDYNIELLDHYSVATGPVKSLDVQGRKAYISVHLTSLATDSMRILNISDPANILMTGSRNTATYLGSCGVDGDFLAAGNDIGNLLFYNVSNPFAIPSPVDQVVLDGNVTSLDFEGKFLYVGLYGSSSSKGLLTFDIEDPTAIIKIENDYVFSQVLGIDVRDQIAFVADDSWGLFIENLTNPYDIQIIKQVDTTGNATDVLVDGGYAYLADGVQGTQIIDIQELSTSHIVGSYDTDGYAQKLAKQGNTLFVADGSNGVVILDVANPMVPSYVDRIDLPYTYDVDMFGDVLLVSTADGVYSYKISTVASLPLVGTFDTYDAKDVVVQGDIAYVAAGTDGLLTINVSNPANPVLLDQYNHSASVNYVSLDVQGNHVYVTSVGGILYGLLSFDVSDPVNIVYLHRVIYTYGYDVCVEGDVAYIADGILGMYLLNISNPSQMGPNIGSSMTDLENYTSVDVQGHFIYAVGTGVPQGLYIYDATDLSNLVVTGTFSLSYLSEVRVEGDYAFLADGTAGGWYINVTDPHNLPLSQMDYYDPESPFAGGNSTLGVDIVGRYMLMAAGNGGVLLLDGSTQNDLQLIASYVTPTINAERVKVAGDFVYVAAGDSLIILRLFDSPGATFESSNVAQSLAIDNTPHLIENATLTHSSQMPAGTTLAWELTADGGTHWEAATPGVELQFSYPGNDLRWRAILGSNGVISPAITSVQVDYEVNAPPTAPALNDPGITDDDGSFTVDWNASIDDGTIDHYLLEMSTLSNFSTIMENWTTASLSQDIEELANGTYHFRVRAFDDDGALSDWSSTESIDVEIPSTATTTTDTDTDTDTGTTTPPPLDDTFLIIIIAVAAGVVVIIIIIILKKKS